MAIVYTPGSLNQQEDGKYADNCVHVICRSIAIKSGRRGIRLSARRERSLLFAAISHLSVTVVICRAPPESKLQRVV